MSEMRATGKLHRAFCGNAKEQRKRLGLTQEDAAKRLGISPERYCEIESGRSAPTITLIERVADALEIPAAMLLVEHQRATTAA